MKRKIENLIDIMALLRDPQRGCPWDLKQTFQTIAPYTLEEAYEVYDAIEQNNLSALKEELGDLLLQVIYYAQMAQEQNLFGFDDLVQAICDKMIRRHPHIFGNFDRDDWQAKPIASWETQKANERHNQKTLEGVAKALPALTRAIKLQARAARVGFDWSSSQEIFAKIQEEIKELEIEINNLNPAKIEEELGDVLFVITNLARKLKINPEEALHKTNQKFIKRFEYIEQKLQAKKQKLSETSLDEMEVYWQEAKNQV